MFLRIFSDGVGFDPVKFCAKRMSIVAATPSDKGREGPSK
jgi:hypothetical protein